MCRRFLRRFPHEKKKKYSIKIKERGRTCTGHTNNQIAAPVMELGGYASMVLVLYRAGKLHAASQQLYKEGMMPRGAFSAAPSRRPPRRPRRLPPPLSR